MLFLAILLGAAGYTLVYAGVKGDSYQLADGTPAWRQPWGVWVGVLTGKPAGLVGTVGSAKGGPTILGPEQVFPPSGGATEGGVGIPYSGGAP
jgi:hypothetical protein